MNNLKSLQRDILISKLTRTEEQVEFHSTHTFVYGIYDNFGVETFNVCNDWDTTVGLEKLDSDLSHMSLRTRFNPQRDSTVYLLMLKNELVETIRNMFKEDKFLEAKKLLIDFGIKV
jgi:hypothetical protein